jgi:ABC-type Mn2+/Zn2+ transport system ATPase subunit
MTGRYEVDLITCTHAAFSFGRDQVLSNVDLSIDQGCFLGLVGPSGAGKTTLLRLLLGAIVPGHGSVTRLGGLRVGYVPQLERIDWSFPVTVGEVVRMGLARKRRLPWTSQSELRQINTTLDSLGLGGLADRHIGALSGGQQQRVFLARALASEPQLLLLDEPTSGVDIATRHDLLHLLGDLHAAGTSIVLTTHDLNGMAAHLPELACINKTVVARGAPHQVLTPTVLEKTYGVPMDVLDHMGVPMVVERGPSLRSAS